MLYHTSDCNLSVTYALCLLYTHMTQQLYAVEVDAARHALLRHNVRIALGAKAARDRVKCLRADFVTLACGAAFAANRSSSRNGSTATTAAAAAAATAPTSTTANSSRSASPLTALASPSSTSGSSLGGGQLQVGADGSSEMLLLNGVTGRGVTGYVAQPLHFFSFFVFSSFVFIYLNCCLHLRYARSHRSV
jgi:hypothetical protein